MEGKSREGMCIESKAREKQTTPWFRRAPTGVLTRSSAWVQELVPVRRCGTHFPSSLFILNMSILSVLNTAFNAPSHMISRPFVGFCKLLVLMYAHNFFTTCGRESKLSWTSSASGSLSCDEITNDLYDKTCEAYDTPQDIFLG
jgi:hypothetical protein